VKVSLRPISRSDTANILKWRNSDNVRSNFVFQDILSREAHERWLNDYIDAGNAVQFIIVVDGLGDIGSVYLRDVDKRHRKAEFGIFIGEECARGKGFGTVAAKLIVEHAFDVLDLNRVFLRVFADNIYAIKSYESAGFTREGCFIEDVIIDGKPRDMVFMAQLRSEYERNRRKDQL